MVTRRFPAVLPTTLLVLAWACSSFVVKSPLSIHPRSSSLVASTTFGVTAGLEPSERQFIQNLLQTTTTTLGEVDLHHISCPAVSVPGATGRVLGLSASCSTDDDDNEEEEIMDPIHGAIASAIDEDLYSKEPTLKDPVSIVMVPEGTSATVDAIAIVEELSALVREHQVCEFDLQTPMGPDDATILQVDEASLIPSRVIKVDGALVQENGKDVWDTSMIAILDDFVSDDLRRGLLSLVAMDDGDSERWIRGSLDDLPTEGEATCWGMTPEAIHNLCNEQNDAIQEMESRIVQLFPDFLVSRLPEAIYGESISPLTANAPTHGDSFCLHIDGDPWSAPPSPWTDVFGRYANRATGKPRFLSLLVYLNDEWDPAWGAPTRFVDVSTNTTVDVTPRPGRVVLMDQDVTHTVVAPESIENGPRYSLVWKLVMHPKEADQNMRDIACGRIWPASECIGSAAEPLLED